MDVCRHTECRRGRPFLRVICSALLIGSCSSFAQWPVDGEPYGMMGCRFFKYRGFWEAITDSADEEESTEAICITVAVASVMNYHRWPAESFFDGTYKSPTSVCLSVPIAHRWQYELIHGPGRRNERCEEDDPGARTLPWKSGWTGLDEIRHLMYAVERSYGCDAERFRTPGRTCEGVGDYSVAHLMRNRFGYPGAKAVSLKAPSCRKLTVQNLTAGLPVIAMRCEHTLVLDGFRKRPKTGTHLFHVADYVSGEESTGWFPWRKLVEDGVTTMVVGLGPDVMLRGGGAKKRVQYCFGDAYIPCTGSSARHGFIRVLRSAGSSLGRIQASVILTYQDSGYVQMPDTVYRRGAFVREPFLRIPSTGTFPFDIGDRTTISLILRNRDQYAKKVRILLHDFEAGHDITPGDEKSVVLYRRL